jgi:hypothetical protein
MYLAEAESWQELNVLSHQTYCKGTRCNYVTLQYAKYASQ